MVGKVLDAVCNKLMVDKTYLRNLKNSATIKKKMTNLITKYVKMFVS